jgi:RNA polymerase sigma factor (sigma-70 family)
VIDEPTPRRDEVPSQPALQGFGRDLIPRVLAGLVRRGEDFDAAEDALQEALLEALRVWPAHPPRDPRAWLATVATRRLVDARRNEAARHRREEATSAEPPAGTPTPEEGDDTLFLLFCCCHPDLAPASQVALTLRAVGGLTTREIADAFYVPEATMAQRISRAKRTLAGPPARRLDQPGDLAVVLRVLYLVYTAGHTGPPARVDLAGEAIRFARQLTLATEEPEARGLLALMLLNHARLPARLDSDGRIVTLDRQDRGLWDTRQVAEGVRVLQSALVMQTEERRPGRYQVQAAIAALHDDAASATGGTPSAPTCTSSAATSLPRPQRTPRPPAGPRMSPSATTWSARPPARGRRYRRAPDDPTRWQTDAPIVASLTAAVSTGRSPTCPPRRWVGLTAAARASRRCAHRRCRPLPSAR